MPKGARMSRIEDRRYIGNKKKDYYRAGSIEYVKDGQVAETSIFLNGFRNNYLADLSWASYEVPCDIVNFSFYSTSIDWFLSIPSRSASDNFSSGSSNEVKHFRFKLPARLVQKFTDIATKASNENTKRVKELRKKHNLDLIF